MNLHFAKNLIRQPAKFYKLRQTLSCRNYSVQQSDLIFGEDVLNAKQKGLPIVALESTIITHGMPYPDNLTTALEVEDIIRKKNVVPATIAIINGKIKVGASKNEIKELANNEEKKNIIKVSRRDFSFAISKSLTGGTTVSGTMLVAEKAGIPIMATGGIGGVHREVAHSMDISADLKELGQTQVAVVCSGVKAILDIPKTLEYLESEGVPVATIGNTSKFPAFYCRETFDGIESPMRISDAKEASCLVLAQKHFGLKTGILFAVPIPENFSLDPEEIELIIKKAVKDARDLNITGKKVTPYLLEKLSILTAGRSLQANKSLIKNNAEVAAEIALHLAKMQYKNDVGSNFHISKTIKSPTVIGGSTYDTIFRIKEPEINFNGSTHRGESEKSCGGVGRNLTCALINLGITDTKLFSVIGDDDAGKAIADSLGPAGTTVKKLPNLKTARYTAIVDNKGNCCFGIGEMEAFTKLDEHLLQQNINIIKNSSFLVLDGNLTFEAMRLAVDISKQEKIPIWYEPTDLHKALTIFECESKWKHVLKCISPNLSELITIAKYFKISIPSKESEIDLKMVKNIAEQLVDLIPIVITTLGAQGVLISRKSSEHEPFFDKHFNLIETSNIQSRLYPILNLEKEVANVSGCGDCLAAGIISGVLRGWKESSCISLGLHAAKQSLFSYETVPKSLKLLPTTQEFFDSNLIYNKL